MYQHVKRTCNGAAFAIKPIVLFYTVLVFVVVVLAYTYTL